MNHPYKRRKVWWFNGDLVSILHISNADNIVTLIDWTLDRNIATHLGEFKRRRRRAFGLFETARLLNVSHRSLFMHYKAGDIPAPAGRAPGNKITGTLPVYYTEEQVFQIRQIMAGIHIGKPRKDGLITNNKIPSEAELSARIHQDLVLYVKDADGNFIPTFRNEV